MRRQKWAWGFEVGIGRCVGGAERPITQTKQSCQVAQARIPFHRGYVTLRLKGITKVVYAISIEVVSEAEVMFFHQISFLGLMTNVEYHRIWLFPKMERHGTYVFQSLRRRREGLEGRQWKKVCGWRRKDRNVKMKLASKKEKKNIVEF